MSAKEFGQIALWTISFCLLFLVVAAIFGAFGRVASPFAEETRRQTYETSRSYNQGMAVDLDDLCRQRRLSSDNGERAILADTIRLRAARYDSSKLPPNVQRCLEDVQ